jgi:AcrR family transcriptional regulator
VAAVAGFSIGTLYQYFPSKEMLVRAMASRGQDLVLQELESYLSALESRADVQHMDGRELLSKAIHILLLGFASGKGLSQTLIRLGWTLEKPDETASAVRQVADRLSIFFERIDHPALQSPSAAQMFVLTRSVIGTLRSASLEKSPLLGSPAFEEALTHMAWALLAKPVQAKPVSAKPN